MGGGARAATRVARRHGVRCGLSVRRPERAINHRRNCDGGGTAPRIRTHARCSRSRPRSVPQTHVASPEAEERPMTDPRYVEGQTVETETVETDVDNNEGGTEAMGAGAGALAGAGVGAVVGGPVGAAVGGVIGAVGGAVAGEAAEGDDEAGAGVGAGGGAVAGAVVGGALAGPPGAVVGGAVGAGAGAGAGDKTEEAATEDGYVET